MLAFLQALASFPTVLVVVAILSFVIWRSVKFVKKHPTVLLGACQLLQSPSGVFGLLTLGAITLVTIKQPSVGGTAFAAFVAVVPAILAFCEHREAMAGIASPPPPPAMVELPPPPDPAKPNNEPIVA
jgi:hypothetical protein